LAPKPVDPPRDGLGARTAFKDGPHLRGSLQQPRPGLNVRPYLHWQSVVAIDATHR